MNYTEDELDNMDEDFIQYELDTILGQIENEQANSGYPKLVVEKSFEP